MLVTEQFGCEFSTYLYTRKRKFICDSICEVLGSVLKLQENEEILISSSLCIKGIMVHEIMPST